SDIVRSAELSRTPLHVYKTTHSRQMEAKQKMLSEIAQVVDYIMDKTNRSTDGRSPALGPAPTDASLELEFPRSGRITTEMEEAVS
ncbi:MAG: hypothetical protein SNJ49_15485, partial [Chloracidobacterium sp.]